MVEIDKAIEEAEAKLVEAQGCQVDGDKLAEAFRRVTPFMCGPEKPVLHSVYVEAHGGTLELTTTDGFRMAHLTLEMDFPVGDYVLDGEGVKDFAFRHYSGQVPVEVVEKGVKLGEVVVARVEGPYPNYRRLKPEAEETMAIVETRGWIKALRQHHPDVVGVVFSPQGCRMYFQQNGETTGREDLPVQMCSGVEMKVAFKGDHLRRALTSCGRSATIKPQQPPGDPLSRPTPTLLEAGHYWHLLMPHAIFPSEVNLSERDREALKWAEDALQAVRKGEVEAKVVMGGGRFYLELGVKETQIFLETPELAKKEG